MEKDVNNILLENYMTDQDRLSREYEFFESDTDEYFLEIANYIRRIKEIAWYYPDLDLDDDIADKIKEML